MPELPDVSVYLERLTVKVVGQRLERVKIGHPFLLRTVAPPISAVEGRTVIGVERLGKRIVLAFEGDLFLVIHLMIAGRLRWLAPGKKAAARNALAFFEFATGTLALTEAGKQRRASLHVVAGRAALAALDAGGIDVMTATRDAFAARLARREPHRQARADRSAALQRHRQRVLRRDPASRAAVAARAHAARSTTRRSIACSRRRRRRSPSGRRGCSREAGDWPEKVTAFHPAMAVHGRFGQPCPDCGAPVQRIVRADNETNYCARCQTGGKVLADRALSRLLKDSWPKHIDELL